MPCPNPAPCVLIPTYNNPRTLEGVVRGASELALPIIVVDDASTDTTPEIIQHLSDDGLLAAHLRTPKNLGKAGALKLGFKQCGELGFTHAIAIDADGQHDPTRLGAFAEAIRSDPDAYVLGCRFPLHPHQPKRNLLGRTLSNVAIRAHCGLSVGDAPCGMRGWPLQLVREVSGRSGRYAWEEEMISRAVWAGWHTMSVDIPAIYHAPHERVSHYAFGRDWSEGIGIFLLLLVEACVPWKRRRRGPWYGGVRGRLLALFTPGPFQRNRPEGRTEAWFLATSVVLALIVFALVGVSWVSLGVIWWIGWRCHSGLLSIVIASAASIAALLSPWLVAFGIGVGLAGIVGGSKLSPSLRRPDRAVHTA